MKKHLAKKLIWAAATGVASGVVRRVTRRAMHDPFGGRRLPRMVTRRIGFGPSLAWAAGTGALLAIVDVLREQKEETVELGVRTA